MFEPLTQTVPQLAARWNCSVNDVITHALENMWPLYFQFDGLVIDVDDTANRSWGNFKQVEGAAQLKTEIEGAEGTLARNSLSAQGKLKLTEWEDALTGEEMSDLRQDTNVKIMALKMLSRQIEKWNQQRQRFQRNGSIRAAPLTLQGVAEQGSAPFPIKAFHPESPVRLVQVPDGNGQLYEGRLVALESTRFRKETITADDLFATMVDIKRLDPPTLTPTPEMTSIHQAAGTESVIDAAETDSDVENLRATSGLRAAPAPIKIEEWITSAREIAKGYIARHKESNLYPTLADVSGNVESELRERGLFGAHRRPVTAAYIQRNALGGDWWRANKP